MLVKLKDIPLKSNQKIQLVPVRNPDFQNPVDTKKKMGSRALVFQWRNNVWTSTAYTENLAGVEADVTWSILYSKKEDTEDKTPPVISSDLLPLQIECHVHS